MKPQEVYKRIKAVADDLCKEHKTWLRADLAFELKKYGIASDTSEVSQLVYEAYIAYNHDGNIAIAFVSNNSRTTLIAEYKLTACLGQGQREQALDIAESSLQVTSGALDTLQSQIDSNLELVLAKGSSAMADIVTGTSGVKDVRSKASDLFDKYSKMVDAYHYAEDNVRSNISDFISLRSDMEATYREYAMKLIDVYGDSIKMIAPTLFDFNRVEWLDVDSMLKHVELEYNKIQDKCGALIAEISDSFRMSLQNSLSAYKSTANGSKSVGLAMAGLTMLSHYMSSNERTNQLRGDLAVLQNSMKHDSTRIKADMGRLLVIYKTLNDVVIPKANVYLRFAAKLMDSDFKAMTDALYASADVRPLEEQRTDLLRQMKNVNVEINDHLTNIDLYTSLVEDISSTLTAKQPSYEEAKSKKPSKPFFLINWLTFGVANKNYYRNYAEWDAACAPLIREYDNYQVDLKLDKEELASHQEALNVLKNNYDGLAAKLNVISKEIRTKVVCTEDLQQKMLKHLRSLIVMLKLGREIIESKLDEKLIHTVDIPNLNEITKLPADIEQNLTEFTNILSNNLSVDQNMSKKLLNEIAKNGSNKQIKGKQKKNSDMQEYSEEDLAMVTDKANETLQQGVALFDSIARLKLQQLHGKIAAAAYDEEFARQSAVFKRFLNQIDNKSAYLRQVFKRINLADNEDERKQAMELLSDFSGYSLSEQDFAEFMKGNKQIEL